MASHPQAPASDRPAPRRGRAGRGHPASPREGGAQVWDFLRELTQTVRELTESWPRMVRTLVLIAAVAAATALVLWQLRLSR